MLNQRIVNFLMTVAFMGLIGAMFSFDGGVIVKVTISTITLLVYLGALVIWRSRKSENNIIDERYPRRDPYKIKKIYDRYDMPDALMNNDFCILETRNMEGDFETLVYIKDAELFNQLQGSVKWEIQDPLKCSLLAKGLNFKEVADLLSDIFGHTLVSTKIGSR